MTISKLKYLALAVGLLFHIFADASNYSPRVDAILKTLDTEIEVAPKAYVEPKDAHISAMKSLLSVATNPGERFEMCRALFMENLFYNYDAAYAYSQQLEQLAAEMSDSVYTNLARLAYVSVFTTAGFTHEAASLAGNIDDSLFNDRDKILCYLVYAKLLQEMEMKVAGSSELAREYRSKRHRVYDKLLKLTPDGSYEKEFVTFERARINNLSLERGIEMCKKIIANLHPDGHQRAINFSTIGLSYKKLGETDSAIYYLALSAIYDLRSNIRETTAARDLAAILFEQGDLDRAERYILRAREDADLFNSRARTGEINAIMSAVKTEQSIRLLKRQNRLTLFSVVAVALLGLLTFLVIRIKKRNVVLTELNDEKDVRTRDLEQSNIALNEVNTKMRESNQIKDQIIIQSLQGNADFINTVEERSHRALMKLKRKNYGELNCILEDMGVEREQARMFKAFDATFLQLYPNFIDDFNALLKPEFRIAVTDGKLPTEMRIFALYMLGIESSTDIARRLGISVNTVYVYKARVKARSICDKADFDSRVKAIPRML